MKKKYLTLAALFMSAAIALSFTACTGDDHRSDAGKPTLDNTDDTELPGHLFWDDEPDDPGPDNPNPDDPGPNNPDPDNPNPDNPGPGGEEQPTVKSVSKIAVKVKPKSEYWTGDTLSLEGGILTVTYKDKTTAEVPMTDGGVTVGTVNMNVAAVSKSVKVTYGGKSTQFTIKVKEAAGTVTFDFNYDSSEPEVTKYEVNKAIAEPETPTRSGFTFDKWYEDKTCTVAYDFGKINSGNLTIYAGWKDDAKTYVNFTYDLNYYGVATQTYSQLVVSGESSRTLGFTPARAEFTFDGWYTDKACTGTYTQGAVSGDTTVYAKWTKTKSGTSTYKFEGEDCDMDAQEGPGLSGSAGGGAMMVTAKNPGVSGKVVSYLYKEGLHVDFCLASSEDAVANLKVYVASEFDFNLNSGMYKIRLYNSANGEGLDLDYEAVDMKDGAPVTCITIKGVQLKEGYNTISLITANSANPLGQDGLGTYKGTAPMIDCIELETSSVVVWDGTKGLPKQY